MTSLRIVLARVWALCVRRRLENELDRELHDHVTMATADYVQQGVPREDARRRALLELGHDNQIKALWRDAHGFTPLDDVVTDMRLGTRLLLKHPSFAAVALATLAISIGANTAIFSVVHAVLLAPLPVAAGDRLVWLGGVSDEGFPSSVSIPNYYSWEVQNHTFESIGARRNVSFTVTGGGEVERIPGSQVLGDFFGVLGRVPVHGRTIRADETARGAPPVAVMSYDLWQRRYDLDATVIDDAITLDGEPFTIIGVMPPDFRFGEAEIWVPMGADDTLAWEARGSSAGTYAIARLRPGVTVEQAAADMERVGRHVRADTGWNGGMPTVTPLRDRLVGDLRPTLLVLFGAVGFALLLACVNLANLLVARGDARRREFAVRTALGAGRGRLIRQMLAESVVMALIGGASGLALARWMMDALVSELPPRVVLNIEMGLATPVLLFTLAVSLLTGLLFGLLPALRASGVSLLSLSEALRGGGRSAGSSRRQRGIRDALVVCELALALVLLVGAGFMIQSLARLQAVDPGFRTDGIATMWISLPDLRYTDTDAWVRFYEHLLDRVDALPGVQAVGVSNAIPLGTGGSESSALPDNRPIAFDATMSALFQAVNGDYFTAMDIPVLRGRVFDDRDVNGRSPVAVIDETMAEAFWPGEDPIGRRVAFEFEPDRDNPVPLWREVVGVVGHVRHYDLREPSRVELYVPFTQPPTYFDRRPWPMALLVQTEGDATSIVSAVRGELSRFDSALPLHTVRTMDEILEAEVGSDRLLGGALTAFSVVALILAVVGVYGMMAYSVSERTHEVGVRMALGARPSHVVRLMMRRVLALVAAGSLAGLATAAAMSRSLSSLVFEVNAGDPLTFGAIALLLATAACFAGYVPARRAAGVSPLDALRCE